MLHKPHYFSSSLTLLTSEDVLNANIAIELEYFIRIELLIYFSLMRTVYWELKLGHFWTEGLTNRAKDILMGVIDVLQTQQKEKFTSRRYQ